MGKTYKDYEPGERRASAWTRDDGVVEVEVETPPAPAPTFMVKNRDAACYLLTQGCALVQSGYLTGFVFLNPHQMARKAFEDYMYNNPTVSVRAFVQASRLMRDVIRIGTITEPICLMEGEDDGHGRAA